MPSIIVKFEDENSQNFRYSVLVGQHSYRLTLRRDYYQNLSAGKIGPKQLIEWSFEFLLKREDPESILPEFDLAQIQHYFPDYEGQIVKYITE